MPRRVTKYRLEARYLALATVLIGGLILADRANALGGLDGTFNTSSRFGVVGIFLVAVVANTSLLIQVPYTIPLLAAALGGSTLGHMLLLGLAAGFGASIGVLISYVLADKVLARRPELAQSRLFRWVSSTVDRRPRLTAWFVFAWAAVPAPDDVVIIPLAMVRYGLRKISGPLCTGKLVHNVCVAALFYSFTTWFAGRISGSIRADVAVGIAGVFVLIILYQVEKARSRFAALPAASTALEGGSAVAVSL